MNNNIFLQCKRRRDTIEYCTMGETTYREVLCPGPGDLAFFAFSILSFYNNNKKPNVKISIITNNDKLK